MKIRETIYETGFGVPAVSARIALQVVSKNICSRYFFQVLTYFLFFCVEAENLSISSNLKHAMKIIDTFLKRILRTYLCKNILKLAMATDR